MVKVVGVPKLEAGDLLVTHGTPAVDEVLGDNAHLGDVEVLRNLRSVLQLKINRFGSLQDVLYF